MSAADSDEQRRGAYGLCLTGLRSVERYLTIAPDGWPRLVVERVVGAASRLENDVFVGGEWAGYDTLDQHGQIGSVRLDRESLRARFTSPGGFSDHAMVHPNLGMIAAVTNYWLGRDAFHAGAFVTEAGAWAVLGVREAGKSSLLGQLASKGVGILSDDVVVLDEGRVLAGPRCVDLREGAACWLGQGDDLGMVGNRRRWRVHVPQVPAAVPLRGWIVPVWADRIRFDNVPPAVRLRLLVESFSVWGVPRPPERLLPLIALPFLEFARPRRWEEVEAASAALLERLDE